MEDRIMESYQDMEKRMEEILGRLKDESLSLDEQIALGEEGRKLIERMEKILDELKKKVDVISSSSTKGSEE